MTENIIWVQEKLNLALQHPHRLSKKFYCKKNFDLSLCAFHSIVNKIVHKKRKISAMELGTRCKTCHFWNQFCSLCIDLFLKQFIFHQVEELLTIHKPFLATPDDWVSCKGSEPQFRGYPCSLWQLFHSMMVNAAARGKSSAVLFTFWPAVCLHHI